MAEVGSWSSMTSNDEFVQLYCIHVQYSRVKLVHLAFEPLFYCSCYRVGLYHARSNLPYSRYTNEIHAQARSGNKLLHYNSSGHPSSLTSKVNAAGFHNCPEGLAALLLVLTAEQHSHLVMVATNLIVLCLTP